MHVYHITMFEVTCIHNFMYIWLFVVFYFFNFIVVQLQLSSFLPPLLCSLFLSSFTHININYRKSRVPYMTLIRNAIPPGNL